MFKGLRVVLAAVLFFCLLVYVTGSLAGLATNPGLMLTKFHRYADTTPSGVPDEEYEKLAKGITAYLDGAMDTAQMTVTRDGVPTPAFSERELAHLQDIRGLVILSQGLRWAAIALIALLAGTYVVFKRRASLTLRQLDLPWSVRVASGMFFLTVLGIALWGLVNFDGLFVAFHRVLFRNDLWLLDQQQHLLLQLMPTSFFVSYGFDLLKQNAFLLLILPLAAFGLRGATKETS